MRAEDEVPKIFHTDSDDDESTYVSQDGASWIIFNSGAPMDYVRVNEDEKDDFIAGLIELRRQEKEGV